MKEVDLTEFRAAFLAEAEELLATANRELLAIEAALRNGEKHARAVRELFRAMHTMKGLAAMVGVDPVVAIAHHLEAALRDANQGRLALAPPMVETMLEAVRAIALRIGALAQGRDVAEPPPALLEALQALEGGEAVAPPATRTLAPLDELLEQKLGEAEREQLGQGVARGARAVQIEFAPSPERAAAGVSITSVRERLAAIAEIVKVIPRSRPVGEGAPAGIAFVIVAVTSASDDDLHAATSGAAVRELALAVPAPPEPVAEPLGDDEPGEPPTSSRAFVRVEVARIDEAMDRMSMLVVTRYRLQRAVRQLGSRGAVLREAEEALAQLGRQLRDLRAAILSVRMVPVADMLDRVPLLVRGLARSTGKQVQLDLDIGRTEVDKAVAERIFPAIVHLVRNAVDHAIEPPDERARRGKPERGELRITSVERSNAWLELTVEDDGAGVDAAAVARRAGHPVPTTDAELLDLLCLPGLSTRTETTTTSGRGMGMDIVRRVVVEQLGGELTLETHPGRGTRFVLRVPLTVSIVDAFTFESGGERYAVPVSLVEEIVEVEAAHLVRLPASGGATDTDAPVALLSWREHTLPFVVLARRLGRAPARASAKAFVTRRNGELVAFAVEQLLGQQEVVVRPLDDALVQVPGVTGSTDLGDGRPTLVLDPYALGRRGAAGDGRAA